VFGTRMRSSTFVTPQMKLTPLMGEQSPSGTVFTVSPLSVCWFKFPAARARKDSLHEIAFRPTFQKM